MDRERLLESFLLDQIFANGKSLLTKTQFIHNVQARKMGWIMGHQQLRKAFIAANQKYEDILENRGNDLVMEGELEHDRNIIEIIEDSIWDFNQAKIEEHVKLDLWRPSWLRTDWIRGEILLKFFVLYLLYEISKFERENDWNPYLNFIYWCFFASTVLSIAHGIRCLIREDKHKLDPHDDEEDSVLNLSIYVEYVPAGSLNPRNSWMNFWKWRLAFHKVY